MDLFRHESFKLLLTESRIYLAWILVKILPSFFSRDAEPLWTSREKEGNEEDGMEVEEAGIAVLSHGDWRAKSGNER